MSSKEFTKKIFAWLAQVKGDHASLSPSAALVALQMIEHFNEKEGGAAWAGCRKIADAIGVSKATVITVIHQLEGRGHLRVEWGEQGRGHSNHYWMLIKGQLTDLFDDGKGRPTDLLARSEKVSPSREKVNLAVPKVAVTQHVEHGYHHRPQYHLPHHRLDHFRPIALGQSTLQRPF